MTLKEITHSEEIKFSQAEIDRMFWNYCIGLLDLANAALPGDDNLLLKLNSLADTRRSNMRRAFDYTAGPSYTVEYRYDAFFSIKETKV